MFNWFIKRSRAYKTLLTKFEVSEAWGATTASKLWRAQEEIGDLKEELKIAKRNDNRGPDGRFAKPAKDF